jgi:hypothetical protein
MTAGSAIRLRPGFVPAILVALLMASTSSAEDTAWVRYENPHFVAYSNAPEEKVAPLLSDLETFRAAFLQVGNISVPPDAPKTAVLITASNGEFHKLKSSKLAVGFAIEYNKRTLIVMSVKGDRKLTRTIIRHEYGHALLRHKHFDYPAWYEEGFAELVSSTELVNKGQSFTIGVPPQRAKHNGPPLFDWDTLISDEFQPHALTDPRRGSSAYAQAWLLAHYTTLGNDLKNARLLQQYFDALKNGEAQVAAFRSTFGMSASEMWKAHLQDYTKHIPAYTLAYRPGAVQLEFDTSAPDSNELASLLTYLELRSSADVDAEPQVTQGRKER